MIGFIGDKDEVKKEATIQKKYIKRERLTGKERYYVLKTLRINFGSVCL